jgi:hypothetical protein
MTVGTIIGWRRYVSPTHLPTIVGGKNFQLVFDLLRNSL